MPSVYDVNAVCKTDNKNPYEAITHLCVSSYDGSLMPIPLDDCIEGIRCGRFEFYAAPEGGPRERLRIARSPYNRLYLTTDGDRHEPKTLLSLPTPGSN